MNYDRATLGRAIYMLQCAANVYSRDEGLTAPDFPRVISDLPVVDPGSAEVAVAHVPSTGSRDDLLRRIGEAIEKLEEELAR